MSRGMLLPGAGPVLLAVMVLYVLPRHLLPQAFAARSLLARRQLSRLLPVGSAGDTDDKPADANAHANKWTASESGDAVCANESSNR